VLEISDIYHNESDEFEIQFSRESRTVFEQSKESYVSELK